MNRISTAENLKPNKMQVQIQMKSMFLVGRILLCAFALLLAGCSDNDDVRENKKEGLRTVRFSIQEDEFGEDSILTRSAAMMEPQIVDLGDCEAEITVEHLPKKKSPAASRAVATPTHYTIRAYYGIYFRGEIRGTFSGSTFTPDPGTQPYMELEQNQTYDFVCFNDDVVPNGNNLEISAAHAQTARIGRKTIAIGTTDAVVTLSSKHVGCRIQTQILAKKHFPTPITATIESNSANTVPQKVSYDPGTNTYTATDMTTMGATANNSPATPVTVYNPATPIDEKNYIPSWFGSRYGFTSTSDYHYFLPTMDVQYLKLNNIAGTVFWKPMNMNLPKLSTTALNLKANGSYIVKIRLKPNYTYLFSDGTTGFRSASTFGGGNKVPVGLVVDTGRRLAMALKLAWGSGVIWAKTAGEPPQNSANRRNDDGTIFDDFDGEKWTWEASGSKDGTIKANQLARYPAFYYAARYNPGVTLTGSLVGKRWYLPSTGELLCLLPLIFYERPTFTNPYFSTKCFVGLLSEAIAQVGGDELKEIWSSSEVNYGHYSRPHRAYFSHIQYIGFHTNYRDDKHYVRSFIKY